MSGRGGEGEMGVVAVRRRWWRGLIAVLMMAAGLAVFVTSPGAEAQTKRCSLEYFTCLPNVADLSCPQIGNRVYLPAASVDPYNLDDDNDLIGCDDFPEPTDGSGPDKQATLTVPPEIAASATTAKPTTTVAPTTTAKPTTTKAPTTTAKPTTTTPPTTKAPTTTAKLAAAAQATTTTTAAPTPPTTATTIVSSAADDEPGEALARTGPNLVGSIFGAALLAAGLAFLVSAAPRRTHSVPTL